MKKHIRHTGLGFPFVFHKTIRNKTKSKYLSHYCIIQILTKASDSIVEVE